MRDFYCPGVLSWPILDLRRFKARVVEILEAQMTKNEKVLKRALKMFSLHAVAQGWMDCWEIDCPRKKAQGERTCFDPEDNICQKHITNYWVEKAKEELK